MANEARISGSLHINKGNLEYSSKPTAFTADVTGTKGPTPGAIAVTAAGTDVNLSELATPGLCWLSNLDATAYITYGIWDGVEFHPLGELLAGEFAPLRLSRTIGLGTGTGYENLRLKSSSGTINARVDCFEK